MKLVSSISSIFALVLIIVICFVISCISAIGDYIKTKLDTDSSSAKTAALYTLYDSAARGDLNKIKSVLDAKNFSERQEIINEKHYHTTDGGTILHAAVANKHKEVVEYLVSCGANLELTDRHGSTPLAIAAWKEYYDILEYLLTHNANIDPTDVDNETPFTEAARHNRVELVKFLVTRKCNINHKGLHGSTALHHAVDNNNMELVNFLLAQDNVNIEAEDTDTINMNYKDGKISANVNLDEASLIYDPEISGIRVNKIYGGTF